MPRSAVRLLRVLAMCLGLLMAVLAPAGPANAATTWTVTPGGAFEALASSAQFTDTATTYKVTCQGTQMLKGTFIGGAGHPGIGLGQVYTVLFLGCTGANGIPFSLTPTGTVQWRFSGVSYSSTGVTTGTLSGVQIRSNGQCGGLLADPTGQAATLNVTYTDATHTLTVISGNLRLNNASGCPGYWNTGDPITYQAKYVLTPSMVITSP
jgi:hypothetical protein